MDRFLFGRERPSGQPSGRNAPCPCGSGRKFKRCCGAPTANRPAPASASGRLPGQAANREGGPAASIRRLREEGRYEEAKRLGTTELAAAPNDPTLAAELAQIHLDCDAPNDALIHIMRSVRLAPQTAHYHTIAAIALEMLGRDGEAMTALRQAIALEPRNAEAHERLANLLMVHENKADATSCYRRAAEAAPGTRRAAINRARALQNEGRDDQAEEVLRKTIAAEPEHAEAKRLLAGLLRSHGRYEEAMPLLEAATEGTPLEALTAYCDLVNSRRMTPADDVILTQMQALLDHRPLPANARVWLHFGLGKVFDDLGQYADAMHHFDLGNSLVRERRRFDRAQFGASIERMIDSMDAAFLARHAVGGVQSRRPIFVVGMPRSGTTLVEQIISSHQAVAAGGELPFWNRAAEILGGVVDGDTLIDRIRERGQAYEDILLGVSPDATHVTDKTPGNFLWLGLIHIAFPHARIIYCRRNPLDTCLSNYFTLFQTPMLWSYDKGDLAFYYRAHERLMQHWRSLLPSETLHQVNYESLVNDPESETRALIDFLGLPWDPRCLTPEANRRAVHTASQWQVRQPTYRTSVARWRHYEPWLGTLRGLEAPPAADVTATPPTSEHRAIPEARRLARAERSDEAIAILQRALGEAPMDPVLYNEIGSILLDAGRIPDAADCFYRALGLVPEFAVARYNLGATLERQGMTDAAIASFRRAIAHAPDLGAAYSRLGNLLQQRGDTREALSCFRHARERLAEPVEQSIEEAKILRTEGRHQEATAALRAIVAEVPNNALAHAMLGDVLAECGEFDDAAVHMDRATTIEPGRIGTWFNKTIYRRMVETDRPLLERLEGLLAEPVRSDLERSLLHFALGKAYDDLGEPAMAIVHFDAGNAIERRTQNFDTKALNAKIDHICTRYQSARPAISVQTPEPLLIIGLPRSGTTLVEQMLSAHPDIGAGGELEFWTPRFGGAGSAASAERGTEYTALLAGLEPGKKFVTDKNPFNFFNVGEILEAVPGARFINCCRHPVDTCLSIYFTRFAEPQGFAYDRESIAGFYRAYAKVMAHWRTVLTPGQLIDVEYEALTRTPTTEVRRLLDFCGLAWDDACLAPERNSRVIRTASLWQARQPVNQRSVARWRRYEPWLGALRDLLPPEDAAAT